jgi:hypothetical protein
MLLLLLLCCCRIAESICTTGLCVLLPSGLLQPSERRIRLLLLLLLLNQTGKSPPQHTLHRLHD